MPRECAQDGPVSGALIIDSVSVNRSHPNFELYYLYDNLQIEIVKQIQFYTNLFI